MRVAVVIPTYNEKRNIEILITRLIAMFKKQIGLTWYVVVVDDSSPDGTGDVVKEYAKENKRVLLLSRKKKVGLGAAYLAGMHKAFGDLKVEVVIVMDADLSHDPQSIPLFLEQVCKGSDFVVGSRYIRGGAIPNNWPLHRKFLSVFGNYITSLFLGSNVLTDWTSGFRAIKKQVYEKVHTQLENKTEFKGYTFNISFAYHTVIDGFTVGEVPIIFPDRKEGKSKLGLEYLFYTPMFLIKTRLKKILTV